MRKRVIAPPSSALSSGSTSEAFAVVTTLSGAPPLLTISQQAGEDGRLFGSVTTQDIAEAIRDARGITVDRRKVHLEEPIRHVGTYMVVVEVDDGVTSTVKTIVTES